MTESSELDHSLPALIQKLRNHIVWKPGSDARHLLKRKLRGHLAPHATLDDYQRLIQEILGSPNATVYIYYSEDDAYLTVSTSIEGKVWLVIATFDGVMETAFVAENPHSYLERPAFRYIGLVSEVLS